MSGHYATAKSNEKWVQASRAEGWIILANRSVLSVHTAICNTQNRHVHVLRTAASVYNGHGQTVALKPHAALWNDSMDNLLHGTQSLSYSRLFQQFMDPKGSFPDRLCGLVVRVLGYRSGGPGSIPGTTRKKCSGSGTGRTQTREYKLRSYLIEK
jgi:hypothetical protein